MGNICCSWKKPEESDDLAQKLHAQAAQQHAVYMSTDEGGGKRTDLDQAIALYQQALECAPPGHPLRHTVLVNLVFAVFEAKPNPHQAKMIAEYFAELEASDGPAVTREQGYTIAYQLGELHGQFYSNTKNEDHFDSSIRYYRKAKNTYAISPVDALLQIAQLHLLRGAESHYQEAQTAAEEARMTCPEDDTENLIRISTALFEIHKAQYSKLGKRLDLEYAISECKRSLALLPPQDPRRAQVLSDLVRCVWVLLDVHCSSTENEAGMMEKDLVDEAFTLRPPVPDGVLSNAVNTAVLANVLSHPNGNPDTHDLRNAIDLYTTIHAPGSGDATLIRNMASAIWFLCTKTNDYTRFDEVISLYEAAYALPEGRTVDIANNIAVVYVRRSRTHTDNAEGKLKMIADLEKALQYYRDAEMTCSNDLDTGSFGDQISKIEHNIKHYREGGAEKGSRAKQLTEERRPSVTRKATL